MFSTPMWYLYTTMSTHGILGWTGLVGQTLLHQLLAKGVPASEIATYNSKNLNAIRGETFEFLYICCMPATKWWANLHPEEDLQILETVWSAIRTVKATRIFLISTVDVLKSDNACSEHSSDWSDHAYGRHRRLLERWVRTEWPFATILRLPALFGRGLKKNALFDLLHDNQTPLLCLQSEFQWYSLSGLLEDCLQCMKHRIHLAHLVSEPISLLEIVNRWFPQALATCTGITPVVYNLTTLHSFCRKSKESILSEMDQWIAWEQFRKTKVLAASNIGFTMTPDVATCLHHVGINALEVAPTKGTAFADFRPVSMQSLLYGTSIKNVFLEPRKFLDHMEHLMQSAANKGIRTFVFGCPKQRTPDTLSHTIQLFRRVGELGIQYDVNVCIEPNAVAYGCTWLTTISEVFEFVQQVSHPNIRISLDTGNYYMENDTTELSKIPMEWIGHVQISGEYLRSTLSTEEQRTAQNLLHCLWKHGYKGAISFEAREPEHWLEYCKGLGQYMTVLETAFRSLE